MKVPVGPKFDDGGPWDKHPGANMAKVTQKINTLQTILPKDNIDIRRLVSEK